jgi:hypothetical protein
MSVMADDIDPLAATAAYAHGGDPIDDAVERIATLVEVRDNVLLWSSTPGQPGRGSWRCAASLGVRADSTGIEALPH